MTVLKTFQLYRTPLEPPPTCVALVGPPKVGKTVLLQCLLKNYTRQAPSQTSVDPSLQSLDCLVIKCRGG